MLMPFSTTWGEADRWQSMARFRRLFLEFQHVAAVGFYADARPAKSAPVPRSVSPHALFSLA
jgi:hypothetical protein